MKLLQQLEQIVPPPSRPRPQRQVPQKSQPFYGPQLALLLETFVDGNMLQLVLDPRPHLHQRVPVLQQLPQIHFFHRGYPDGGKTFLQQCVQDISRIPLIGLLLARVAGAHLRGIPDQQCMPQPGQ